MVMLKSGGIFGLEAHQAMIGISILKIIVSIFDLKSPGVFSAFDPQYFRRSQAGLIQLI